MSAPLNLTNRFELLLTNNPASLPYVLNQFAQANISPTAVNAVSQGDSYLAVSVTVKHMCEEAARNLQQTLKAVPAVKLARLEHLVI